MNNLKTFEEFDWKSNMGKDKYLKPNIEGKYVDQDLYYSIKNQILSKFDPNKITTEYVGSGYFGYTYDLGKIYVKIHGDAMGILRKEYGDPPRNIVPLNINPDDVSELYFIIKDNLEKKKQRYE